MKIGEGSLLVPLKLDFIFLLVLSFLSLLRKCEGDRLQASTVILFSKSSFLRSSGSLSRILFTSLFKNQALSYFFVWMLKLFCVDSV